MDENNLTIEYLKELQKIAEALNRLELRIDKHFNKLLVARAEESNFVTRAEAAKYLGLSERHFDRRAKEWHFWRYRNHDGTGLRYNKGDKLMIKLMLSNGLCSREVHRININDFDIVDDEMVLHIQRKGSIDNARHSCDIQ